MESHWFQRKDGFARLIHRLNRFLETGRGGGRAEVTSAIDQDRDAAGHSHAKNAGDISVLMSWFGADADGFGFARRTNVTDINIVTASSEIEAGLKAHGNVAAAGGIASERIKAVGGVVAADGVVIERLETVARVGQPVGVIIKCIITRGGVVSAG